MHLWADLILESGLFKQSALQPKCRNVCVGAYKSQIKPMNQTCIHDPRTLTKRRPEGAVSAFNVVRRTNMGDTLDEATTKYLLTNKSPSRKVGELDNRRSHFYLSMFWAQALAKQARNSVLAARFSPIAQVLADNEQSIVAELNAAQGAAVDIGGYYMPNADQTAAAMRPSQTLNRIIDGLSGSA